MSTKRKNRLTISEIMDKLNIGGDITFRQHAKGQKRKAESLMHLLTMKGEDATKGQHKWKSALDTVGDIFGFVPIVGKYVDIGLDALSAKLQDLVLFNTMALIMEIIRHLVLMLY